MSGTVSNTLINYKLDLLSGLGIDIKPLIEKCNINSYNLNVQDGRVHYKQHVNLILATAEYSPYFRSEISSINKLYELFPDLFGLCLNEKTVFDAIHNFLKYRFIMGDCDTVVLKSTKDQLLIEYENDNHHVNSASGHFLFLNELVQNYLEDFDLEVSFNNKPNINQSTINDKLKCICSYNTTKNSMLITSSKIHTQSNFFNKTLNNLQLNNLEQKRLKPNKETFKNNVESYINHLINSIYHDDDNSILEKTCAHFRLSRWTLNKKLNIENTSFSEILKNARINKACSLLKSTYKSIGEISDLCHFSSQASFNKFFKQNKNISPLQYRNGCQEL